MHFKFDFQRVCPRRHERSETFRAFEKLRNAPSALPREPLSPFLGGVQINPVLPGRSSRPSGLT